SPKPFVTSNETNAFVLSPTRGNEYSQLKPQTNNQAHPPIQPVFPLPRARPQQRCHRHRLTSTPTRVEATPSDQTTIGFHHLATLFAPHAPDPPLAHHRKTPCSFKHPRSIHVIQDNALEQFQYARKD